MAISTQDSFPLTFFAGAKALAQIKREGFHSKMIKVMAGAAGGPKWLVLAQLDRLIFSNWFEGRTEPLFLIGSSIAAWRFAAAAQKKPVHAIAKLEEAYVHQTYEANPSASEVTAESRRILEHYLDENGVNEVLGHPYLKLNMFAVRSKMATASERKLPLTVGLAASAFCNIFSRKSLKFFFEQTLFYNKTSTPPWVQVAEFPKHRVALSKENLKPAILASGSIPLAMSGVRDIPGARSGVYRDGGVVDYHLDIPFGIDDGIVLFPHYTDRIIPGWFDKNLPWRKATPENMQNVLVVAPARSFVKNLPFGKIPDRADFKRFQGRDQERISYWNTVSAESRRLADALHEVIEHGLAPEKIRAL